MVNYTPTIILRGILLFLLIPVCRVVNGQTFLRQSAIYSGVPWFDDNGNTVSAHGGCIIKENGLFYFFGERHSDTSAAFTGFNCYSSPDLYNWKFESIALPLQNAGKLGPHRIGERPKVMRCPATGRYVMFMHVDTLGYKDQFIGYATAENITGPYTFKGPVLFDGQPIRKWDMGTFQDNDGTGYILIHGGGIYKLDPDYTKVVEQTNKTFTPGFESPTLFRKGDLYYFLGSHLTSWERNDNYYFTAASLKGPWVERGLIAPKGTLTWNAQSTFVLPVTGKEDTTYMFMGDRWAYPLQASAATYVWQPIRFDGVKMSIPDFKQQWKVYIGNGKVQPADFSGVAVPSTSKKIIYSGNWIKGTKDAITYYHSSEKEASFTIKFVGSQIVLCGLSQPGGGYLKVEIKDRHQHVILSSIVDMYCKYAVFQSSFVSPHLKQGQYSLTASVIGMHGNWTDKSHQIFGSTGDEVCLQKIIIK